MYLQLHMEKKMYQIDCERVTHIYALILTHHARALSFYAALIWDESVFCSLMLPLGPLYFTFWKHRNSASLSRSCPVDPGLGLRDTCYYCWSNASLKGTILELTLPGYTATNRIKLLRNRGKSNKTAVVKICRDSVLNVSGGGSAVRDSVL